MNEHKSQVILVLGVQRSGTTLLAAMLGRHSEINMLFESPTDDLLRSIGKKYTGNKLLTWRQIRMHQRASRFGHFVNRLVNIDLFRSRRHHQLRPFPISSLSINDYIDLGAIIITITRNKADVVKSIRKRTQMSESKASFEYDRAMRDIEAVRDRAINVTFEDLVSNPEPVLQSVCSEMGIEYEPRMMEGPKYNFVYPHDKVIADDKARESSAQNRQHTSVAKS